MQHGTAHEAEGGSSREFKAASGQLMVLCRASRMLRVGNGGLEGRGLRQRVLWIVVANVELTSVFFPLSRKCEVQGVVGRSTS